VNTYLKLKISRIISGKARLCVGVFDFSLDHKILNIVLVLLRATLKGIVLSSNDVFKANKSWSVLFRTVQNKFFRVQIARAALIFTCVVQIHCSRGKLCRTERGKEILEIKE
jgi:hypothetical protein